MAQVFTGTPCASLDSGFMLRMTGGGYLNGSATNRRMKCS